VLFVQNARSEEIYIRGFVHPSEYFILEANEWISMKFGNGDNTKISGNTDGNRRIYH
jgi:hypothetical protein